MNRVINFILWPAVAGLVFGIVLLQLPRLAEFIPGLNAYLPKENSQRLIPNSFSYADAISKAAPAVVSINSTADVRRENQRIFNPLVRQRFLLNDESTSLGSGVIISPDGYIITSYHIFEIQGTDIVNSSLPEITVTLYDGRSLEARPIVLDRRNDLALLKVEETELAYMAPAEQNSLDAGDIVLAIGYPRNIGQSYTQGIISALLKAGDSYRVQTDAAINPGNSGGALIDVNGRLIGINSTIVSESGGSEGISFAVPAQNAFALMQDYIDQDPGGYLGVDGVFFGRIASSMLVDADVQGFLVQEMLLNGPAEKAGLRIKDIILSLVGIEINSPEAQAYAIQTVSDLGPGETVIAEVFREGEILTIPIVLGVGEAFIYLDYTDQSFLDPDPCGESLLLNGCPPN
jgi:serine protease DegS